MRWGKARVCRLKPLQPPAGALRGGGRTALGVIQTGMKAQHEASDNAARARNKVENTEEKITDQKNQQEIA